MLAVCAMRQNIASTSREGLSTENATVPTTEMPRLKHSCAIPAALAEVAAQEQSPGWVLHTLCHLNQVLQNLVTLSSAALDVQAAHCNHEIPDNTQQWTRTVTTCQNAAHHNSEWPQQSGACCS